MNIIQEMEITRKIAELSGRILATIQLVNLGLVEPISELAEVQAKLDEILEITLKPDVSENSFSPKITQGKVEKNDVRVLAIIDSRERA